MSLRRPVRSASVLLVVVGTVLVAVAQPQQPPSQSADLAKTEAKFYAETHPYMDEPLSNLRKRVHELAGLEPSPNQDQLADLLTKTGAKADELLHRLPNLISDERVTKSHYAQQSVNSCVGVECAPLEDAATRDEEFSYMIVADAAEGGQLAVSEYRTARNGKPLGKAVEGAPAFQGFISAWIILSSANQTESRFRYLGKQRVDGHATYVLGFAQIPGSVESPGVMVSNGESIPMLLQGIAWIDQSDFRIVRLRTDLLAPLPSIQVEKQTANILFSAVHIPDFATELWLPKAVKLQMEIMGHVVTEEHNYSKYRLYQVKSRIVLSPKD